MDLKYRLIVVTQNTDSDSKVFYRVDWRKSTGEEGTLDILDLRRTHQWIQDHCNYGVNCKVIWK